MFFKLKIISLAIIPLILVTALITLLNAIQARNLSEEEISTFESNLLNSKRQELRNYIQLAQTSIEHIIRDQQMPEAIAQAEVKRILNELTYGSDGYFFVYNQYGVNLVHPILQDIVGQNLYDMQDINGDFVIRNLLKVANAGGGFHHYVWNRPSTDENEAKISYVISLSRWDWMLGTGLYIDDIANEVTKIREQVNVNIRNTFLIVFAITTAAAILIAVIGIAINLHEGYLANSRLRDLAHKSIQFQIDERRRFSRELHDGINQLMVSVKFRIESASNKLQKLPHEKYSKTDCDRVAFELNHGKQVLNDAIREVRRISHDLRPSLLDDMGLSTALTSLLDQFEERTNIISNIDLALPERLPEDIEITFYRIIQEALTNIERHAKANQVWIRLWLSGYKINLEIKDDGQGFIDDPDVVQEGIGLRTMRERVELFSGEFLLHSQPKVGTRLRAWLPNERKIHGKK